MPILNYIIWNVDPNLFDGFITIRWYGLLFAGAFMAGYYVLKHIFTQEKIAEDWLDKVLMYVMIGTVLGARLGHVFFYDWEYYSQNLDEILKVWHGGLASHGAAIGIIISLWLYSKNVTKKSILWILDRVVITVAIGAVFIRFGNLMNHEIIGKPTDFSWAFIFTRVDQMPRHPAQLYEAICYFASFLFLFFYGYKKAKWQHSEGKLFGAFLILIFSIRILVEFVKSSQGGFETAFGNVLSTGQWLSIPFILIGLYFFFFRKTTPKQVK